MSINKKIKLLRQTHGYTLENLADLTGFTKGYLSKIERSSKTPPFATVQTITEALGADIVQLLDDYKKFVGSKNIEILKHKEAVVEEGKDSSEVYRFKPLVRDYRNKYMSPFLFIIRKGTSELITHDSEEFVYVLEGSICLHYENKTYSLEKGDCFYLDARIKHNFTNSSEKDTLLIAVHFNYRRF